MICAVTYFMEALVFQYEGLNEPADQIRLNFITISSLIFGATLLLYL